MGTTEVDAVPFGAKGTMRGTEFLTIVNRKCSRHKGQKKPQMLH